MSNDNVPVIGAGEIELNDFTTSSFNDKCVNGVYICQVAKAEESASPKIVADVHFSIHSFTPDDPSDPELEGVKPGDLISANIYRDPATGEPRKASTGQFRSMVQELGLKEPDMPMKLAEALILLANNFPEESDRAVQFQLARQSQSDSGGWFYKLKGWTPVSVEIPF